MRLSRNTRMDSVGSPVISANISKATGHAIAGSMPALRIAFQ